MPIPRYFKLRINVLNTIYCVEFILFSHYTIFRYGIDILIIGHDMQCYLYHVYNPDNLSDPILL